MYQTTRVQQDMEAIARIRMEAFLSGVGEGGDGVGQYLMWLEDQLLSARLAAQKKAPGACPGGCGCGERDGAHGADCLTTQTGT